MQQRLGFRAMTLVTILAGGVTLSACGLVGGVGEPVVDVPDGDPLIGRQLIQENGCIACHSIPGIPNADAHVGPPLDNWADRRYIAGRAPNEVETLIFFLMDPKYVDPESAMPVVGLTPDEARDIAAYLYTLSDD